MSDLRATDALREEHRLILAVAAVLERILARTSGRGLDLGAIEDCVTFFRLFADACHHGSEEDLLFTALEEEGIPRDTGPVAALVEEHRFGRSLMSRMAEAIDGARAGDPAAVRTLSDAGEQYVEMIRLHIAKEDDGVFEMADRIVGGRACSALCEAYETVCRRSFEGHTRAELQDIARRLVELHGPS